MEEEEFMAEITRDTMIGDLLDECPAIDSVFLAYGMHCLECSSARGETIEQACAMHGVDADVIVAALRGYRCSK